MTQNLSYVRAAMIDQQDPPLPQKGAVRWVRENLLSGWLNILLTVLSIAAIWYVTSHLLHWFLNAVWNAGSLTECREVLSVLHQVGDNSGACWGVIRDRWTQLLFGSYPPAFYWRSILAMILLVVALMPVLFRDKVSGKLYYFSAFYPFLMPWLLWGGSFWVPLLAVAGFGVGYVALRLLTPVGGAVLGVVGAIVAALVWWIVAMTPINDALHRAVANMRIEGARDALIATQDGLAPRIAQIEADRDAVTAQVAVAVAAKNAIYAPLATEQFRRSVGPVLDEVAALFDGLGATSTQADLAAAYVGAHRLLLDFAPARAPEGMGPLLEQIKTTVRVRVTEDNLADAQEAVAEIGALVAQARGLTAANAMSDADLATGQAAFLGAMRELTALRETQTRIGAELFRMTEERRGATTLLRNIDQRAANIAAHPGLLAAAEEARAALPESVALLTSADDLPEGLAPADVAQLRDALRAEAALASNEGATFSIYYEVGRVGLQPVPSASFGGFQLSLIIGVAGIAMSLPLGILLALGRQSNLLIINKVSVGFIEIIRGVPLIVWLLTAQFLLNYFLPPGTEFDLVLRVIIMVTLFASAYIAEVVRGGLAALPRGQYEAADALGLDYWKSMQLIVLPQALKISIPGIVNTFIGLFKDTTLVLFIGLFDPLGLSNTIRATTEWNGIYWELFIFIGVLFFIFCFSMGRYSLFLERKLQRENR